MTRGHHDYHFFGMNKPPCCSVAPSLGRDIPVIDAPALIVSSPGRTFWELDSLEAFEDDDSDWDLAA